MTDVWLRFKEAYGEWQWRAFHFPDNITTRKARDKYFEEQYASEVLDEVYRYSNAESRRIVWEIIPVPAHIVEARINSIKASIKANRKYLKELEELLPSLKVVDKDAPTKRACTMWPRCGCMKQGKDESCKAPWIRDEKGMLIGLAWER